MASCSKAASFALLDLPLETQRHVFSYLPPESIRPLLYTCKHIHQTVLPFWVHTYRNVEPHDVSKLTRQRFHSRNLQFLRYITIYKPELARHVRSITYSPFTNPHHDEPHLFQGAGLNSNERRTYHEHIDRFVPRGEAQLEDFRSEWIVDLEEGSTDTELCLLLLVCTHITTLVIGDLPLLKNLPRFLDFVAKRRALEWGIQIDPISGEPLSRLSDLYQEMQHSPLPSTQNYVFETCIASFMQLPRLKSYECVVASDENSIIDLLKQIPPRSCAVESLVLRRSYVGTECFKTIANACKALRHIEYTVGFEPYYTRRILPGDFIKSLAPHIDTLEAMHVNFDEDTLKKNWGDQSERSYMGTQLRQFTKLTGLVIGAQALTGMRDHPTAHSSHDIYGHPNLKGALRLMECIPESLRYLEIHCCGPVIMYHIQELLDVLESGYRFPHLQKIRVLVNTVNTWQRNMNLTCRRDTMSLEVVSQEHQHRTFDLITKYMAQDIHVTSICTRIYHPTLRELWLKYRGMDKGRADHFYGVLEIPEEHLVLGAIKR